MFPSDGFERAKLVSTCATAVIHSDPKQALLWDQSRQMCALQMREWGSCTAANSKMQPIGK
jgi:hypothetical protein